MRKNHSFEYFESSKFVRGVLKYCLNKKFITTARLRLQQSVSINTKTLAYTPFFDTFINMHVSLK